MKIVYASRTGNIDTLMQTLNIKDAFKIEMGTESMSDDYILFTYTDGYGDIPSEVDDFISANNQIKGVIASGDSGYGEAFCGSGNKVAEKYNVPCLYKIENDGSDEDHEKIKEILTSFN